MAFSCREQLITSLGRACRPARRSLSEPAWQQPPGLHASELRVGPAVEQPGAQSVVERVSEQWDGLAAEPSALPTEEHGQVRLAWPEMVTSGATASVAGLAEVHGEVAPEEMV